MGENIHVVYDGLQWQVKQEDAGRSSGNFSTQQEAIERAREIAARNGAALTESPICQGRFYSRRAQDAIAPVLRVSCDNSPGIFRKKRRGFPERIRVRAVPERDRHTGELLRDGRGTFS